MRPGWVFHPPEWDELDIPVPTEDQPHSIVAATTADLEYEEWRRRIRLRLTRAWEEL
jgi:hypothetical protein